MFLWCTIWSSELGACWSLCVQSTCIVILIFSCRGGGGGGTLIRRCIYQEKFKCNCRKKRFTMKYYRRGGGTDENTSNTLSNIEASYHPTLTLGKSRIKLLFILHWNQMHVIGADRIPHLLIHILKHLFFFQSNLSILFQWRGLMCTFISTLGL